MNSVREFFKNGITKTPQDEFKMVFQREESVNCHAFSSLKGHTVCLILVPVHLAGVITKPLFYLVRTVYDVGVLIFSKEEEATPLYTLANFVVSPFGQIIQAIKALAGIIHPAAYFKAEEAPALPPPSSNPQPNPELVLPPLNPNPQPNPETPLPTDLQPAPSLTLPSSAPNEPENRLSNPIDPPRPPSGINSTQPTTEFLENARDDDTRENSNSNLEESATPPANPSPSLESIVPSMLQQHKKVDLENPQFPQKEGEDDEKKDLNQNSEDHSQPPVIPNSDSPPDDPLVPPSKMTQDSDFKNQILQLKKGKRRTIFDNNLFATPNIPELSKTAVLEAIRNDTNLLAKIKIKLEGLQKQSITDDNRSSIEEQVHDIQARFNARRNHFIAKDMCPRLTKEENEEIKPQLLEHDSLLNTIEASLQQLLDTLYPPNNTNSTPSSEEASEGEEDSVSSSSESEDEESKEHPALNSVSNLSLNNVGTKQPSDEDSQMPESPTSKTDPSLPDNEEQKINDLNQGSKIQTPENERKQTKEEKKENPLTTPHSSLSQQLVDNEESRPSNLTQQDNPTIENFPESQNPQDSDADTDLASQSNSSSESEKEELEDSSKEETPLPESPPTIIPTSLVTQPNLIDFTNEFGNSGNLNLIANNTHANGEQVSSEEEGNGSSGSGSNSDHLGEATESIPT